MEPLIRALLKGLESFGGVPMRAVFDNPKTIVIGRTKDFIEWNSTFAHVPVDYGFGVSEFSRVNTAFGVRATKERIDTESRALSAHVVFRLPS